MPLQILPRETNWGESLGQGLGSGLSEGLQQLAHMKMKDYFQRNLLDLQQQVKMQEMQRQHDLLEKTLGPGWGNLAYLPEKYGLMAIQGGWSPAVPQTGMQQNLAALAPAEQVTAPTLPQAPSGQVTAPTLPHEMQGPTVTSDLGQAIRQAAYNTPQMKQARELQAQQQAFTERENIKKREFQEAQELRKERNEERKFFHGENKKFYDKLQDSADSAEKMQFEIDKMIQLVRSGKLPPSQYANLVEKLGAGILGSFFNPNTLIGKEGEEYNKLAATLMSGAKDIFGSRITNFDMAQFLKMIPTLMNTDEGKLEILRDLSILNQMKIKHAQIARDIAIHNKGYLPVEFRTELYNKFEPYRKMFAEEFKKTALKTTGIKLKLSEAKNRNLPIGQRARFSDGSIRVWNGSEFIKE